jgi:hypothetical protein
MISVKRQGPYEVFSRGAEEPWSIWRDGRPYRQVWTWRQVEQVLRGDEKSKISRGHATKRARRSSGPPKLSALEIAALDAIRLGDPYDQQVGERLEKHGLVYWMGGELYITSEGREALTRVAQ